MSASFSSDRESGCLTVTSRVIAVLLGVLGMDLDQTSIAFRRMCSATLFGAARSLTPEERTRRLEETIKEILMELQVPVDRPFNSDVDLSDDCKVFVYSFDPNTCSYLQCNSLSIGCSPWSMQPVQKL